ALAQCRRKHRPKELRGAARSIVRWQAAREDRSPKPSSGRRAAHTEAQLRSVRETDVASDPGPLYSRRRFHHHRSTETQRNSDLISEGEMCEPVPFFSAILGASDDVVRCFGLRGELICSSQCLCASVMTGFAPPSVLGRDAHPLPTAVNSHSVPSNK